MHRNTFIDSPRVLNSDYSAKSRDNLFFAGQLTGVEGYMESASAGLMAGINAACKVLGKETLTLPAETMIGACALTVRPSIVNSVCFQVAILLEKLLV
jgi:methylenetetrahydrofolate--tRNA-(uracil-5-)-methyltransferase